MRDIKKCKKDKNCKNLTCRGFYFEPNKHTIKKWQEEYFYKEEGSTKREIKRAIFVCESPGPRSQVKPENSELKRCWGKENANKEWTSLRNLDRFPIRQNRYEYSHIFKNCYITNIVKCGPRPENTDHHSYEEIESCCEWLKKEIEIIQPLVVIAVGGEVYNFLRGKHYKEFIESKGIKLYKIYHYSYFRSDQELFTKWVEQFQAIINDLKLLR